MIKLNIEILSKKNQQWTCIVWKISRNWNRVLSGKINTNFYNNKISKEGSQCICRKDKNYYPQVFLEECKYVVKEKKMTEYVNDEIEFSYDDSDREDSDKENSDEEYSDA